MISSNLQVYIRSFSFKKGFPTVVDAHGGGFMFDCRILKNPGREEKYKSLNGTDPEVVAYIEALPEATVFWEHVQGLIAQAVQAYRQRGFNSLTVWFGCTGGQHRSVYFTERLKKWLDDQTDCSVNVAHMCRSDWKRD